MSFLNSGILGALALISIPLIIHLINRRRAVEHRFAAFDFLMRSKIDSVKRFRLKHLLLFLIRTLLIACIVLGAAMPVFFGKAWNRKNTSGKMLVVLDNSASMRCVEDSLSGYGAGLRFLGNYIEHENVTALKIYPLIGREKEVELQGFAGEFEKAMKDFPVTYAAGRFGPVLKRVAAEMRNDDSYERFLMISDFAQSDWQGVSDSLFRDINAGLVLARTTSSPAMMNAGLTEVLVKSAPETRGMNASVTLLNSGTKALNDFPLNLYLSGRNVLNGFVNVEAGRNVRKDFLVEGGTDETTGEIRITPDAFAADDARFFVFSPLPPIRTVAVDGDQGAHYTASETFFLERALVGNRSGENLNKVITPANFNKAAIKDCRVLFLCNSVPAQSEMENVERFVREGGGLFISLGDRIDMDEFNSRLGPLFKRQLRDKKSGLGHKTAVTGHLVVAEPSHPAVAVLNSIKEPEKYLFNDLYLLEPAPGSGTETLLRTSTGEPLMLSARVGKGLAVLYLSTLDMAWNDFPMRPYFLPFLRETMKFLAGAREQVVRDTVYVNDTLPLPAQGTARIDDPEGQRHVAAGRNGTALFSETALPGHYRVLSDKSPGKWIAVNINPSESAPERLSAERFKTLFGGSSYTVLDVRKDVKAEALKPRPLWHYFFLAAVLLALLEALLCLPEKIKALKK